MNEGIYSIGPNNIATMPYGVNGVTVPTIVKVLVVAGGGGGQNGSAAGTRPIGGGGGGGVLDGVMTFTIGILYDVSIGAGGSAVGNYSRFAEYSTAPGGFGINSGTAAAYATGGGHYSTSRNLSIIRSQGFNGGIGNAGGTLAGGGGGAGGIGVDAVTGQSGNGGIGRQSSTPLVPTYYGGGGGGGCNNSAGNIAAHGVGGLGGGGNGGTSSGTNATAGSVNTGGGGGGGGCGSGAGITGASGGSGIIVLRYSSYFKIKLGTGLTGTTVSSGSDSITTITAGTGTVSFS